METEQILSQWMEAYRHGEVPFNFMLDFETFGNDPYTCGIMSVALIPFAEMGTGPSSDAFVRAVSMESNYEHGFDMASSQQWWGAPDRVMAWSWYVQAEKISLEQLSASMNEIFHQLSQDRKDFRVWSRGCFDWHILHRVLGEGADRLLPYYAWRDARTLIRGLHLNEQLYVSDKGVFHTPCEDALRDITGVQRAFCTMQQIGFFSHRNIQAVTDGENRRRLMEGGASHGI